MRFLVALCLLCSWTASASEDDGQVALHKIRATVAQAVGRSDNYICVQDLSRFYYFANNTQAACQETPMPPASPLRLQDRLKLDVAVSEGTEIYSWHGEHKFSAKTVGQLVRQGPIASGSFNGYLRNIFGERNVGFIFQGPAKVNDLEVVQFDYDVPLEASHYQVQTGRGFTIVPFHGTFAARLDNFELYSLTVIADNSKIPTKANICGAETKLTYQVVRISNHDSLLPASFDLILGGRDLTVTESKGRYSECHEYTGESTVHFDGDDPAAEISAPVLADPAPLRAGVELSVALRTPIDEDSAYAGEAVEATLVQRAKIGKGKTLHPGATLHGTITGMQIFGPPPLHRVALNIEFTSISDGKDLYLCSAIHDRPLDFRMSRRNIGPPPEEPNDGTMNFNTTHLHLDDNFRSLFVTVDQPADESP